LSALAAPALIQLISLPRRRFEKSTFSTEIASDSITRFVLKEAALRAQQRVTLLDTDPRLYSIHSQGHILSEFEFVDQLADKTRDEALSEVPSLGASLELDPSKHVSSKAPFIYLASCNQL
jgi:hypothetical protein